jgi:hypothetical protein
VGREGSAPIRDNELRRVRNLFDSQTVDSDTVFVTGNDVEIDALEAENFEFERVSENDMRQLSLALGVPLELTNYGSDGLGSGKPAEFRLNLFKLQIEANQRQFANIFVRDLLRPVLRDMTPFNHTVNINMEFGDPLQTEKDMATLLQEIGGYMTNEEISERFDLPKPEDEEIAESYRTPAEVEQAEEQGGEAGGAIEGLFNNSRMLDTPKGIPDNAQYLPPGESPPEGATTYPSEGEGSYYIPSGESNSDEDSSNKNEQTKTEDGRIDISDIELDSATDDAVISDYIAAGYKDVNQALRRDGQNYTEETQEMIDTLNKYIEKAPEFDEPTTVHRGISASPEFFQQLAENEGDTVRLEGFQSSSHNEEIAKRFADDDEGIAAVMNIETETGLPVYALEGDINDSEDEIILPHNAEYRINNVKQSYDGVEIDMEVIKNA